MVLSIINAIKCFVHETIGCKEHHSEGGRTITCLLCTVLSIDSNLKIQLFYVDTFSLIGSHVSLLPLTIIHKMWL